MLNQKTQKVIVSAMFNIPPILVSIFFTTMYSISLNLYVHNKITKVALIATMYLAMTRIIKLLYALLILYIIEVLHQKGA